MLILFNLIHRFRTVIYMSYLSFSSRSFPPARIIVFLLYATSSSHILVCDGLKNTLYVISSKY